MVKEDGDGAADFDRLEKLSEVPRETEEFNTNNNYRVSSGSYDGERDKKQDAMNNTAARGVTLQEHLLGQWAFVETTPDVRKAGEAIINYIDPEGYFRTDFELVIKESKQPLTVAQLTDKAFAVGFQTLEPTGIDCANAKSIAIAPTGRVGE